MKSKGRNTKFLKLSLAKTKERKKFNSTRLKWMEKWKEDVESTFVLCDSKNAQIQSPLKISITLIQKRWA